MILLIFENQRIKTKASFMKNNVEEMNIHAVDYPNKCRQKKQLLNLDGWIMILNFSRHAFNIKKPLKKFLMMHRFSHRYVFQFETLNWLPVKGRFNQSINSIVFKYLY